MKTDLLKGPVDILEVGKPIDQEDYHRIVFPQLTGIFRLSVLR